MDITLTRDQESFVRQAIKSGRLQRPEDAVAEALLLWEEREQERAQLLTSLAEAEASLDRGEGLLITNESMEKLADDVKQRGRQRLAEQRQSRGR